MSGGDAALSYLEVLDDEYWQLSGQNSSAAVTDLRNRFVQARLSNSETLNIAEAAFRHDLLARLHAAKRAGLCFSGGGIRSATFGLGVLQGLAGRSGDDGASRPKLLGEFDYLSTVSGGGYLGSWFSAWATRRAKPAEIRFRDAGIDPCDGPAAVIRELASHPDAGLDPEPAPVKHLRSYSNYLTPRLGLSADTWAVAATVVRNIFLNWLVLVPLLAAALLVPVGAQRILKAGLGADAQAIFLIAGFIFGAFATGYIGFDLPSAGNARQAGRRYAWFGLLPIVLAASLLNTYWGWRGMTPGVVAFPIQNFLWFGALMHGGGMLAGILVAMVHFKRPAPITGLYATAAAAVTGTIAGAVGFGVARMVGPIDVSTPLSLSTDTIRYICIAFPLTMAIFMLAGTLLVGLTSYITEDKDREWWARAGGLLLAVTLAWPLFAALVLYANGILDRLTMVAASALGGVSGWGAAKLGGSAQTPSGRGQESGATIDWLSVPGLKQIAAKLALPVFLVMLITLLAFLNARWLALAGQKIDLGGQNDSLGLLVASAGPVALLAAVYLLIGLGSSLFINVNTFSLHAMYKQRLIRAYLGASNEKRDPNRFTGFDENDNMPMCALTTHKPLHIVNMALNLVAGKNLAWQQRKAESFTSTRLHTGGTRVGYRPSAEYGGKYPNPATKTAISLGTAITVSGAAASPNMGYNSSPLLTVVMTLFNARLGWWLGNPASSGTSWRRSGPRFGVRPFLDEMFGNTDDENTWVYLSDGGHFENLGLYELVLRRCAVIVVSDSGADPTFEYADLGNAVRKIRVDLGIAIDFDTTMPMSSAGHATPHAAGHHCAIGHIRYSDRDIGAEDGLLIYLKPSLSGDEPADIQHYASQDCTFPHQSTTDQFFDEAQFESYRRLGLHVIERICRQGETEGQAGLDLGQFSERAKSYAASQAP